MKARFRPAHLLQTATVATLLLGATAAQAQNVPDAVPVNTRYRAWAIGLTPVGWDAPYGFGIELSHLVTRRLDLNVGTGIGLSGTKLGLGTRYFFAPEKRVSSYVGANLVYSGGWSEMELREGGGDDWYEGDGYRIGTLTVKPTTVLHLRYGLRWQPGKRPGRVGILGTVGYGLRVSGNPMVYRMDPGYDKPGNFRQLLDRSVYAPGGIEMSIGLSIGLGQKMRE